MNVQDDEIMVLEPAKALSRQEQAAKAHNAILEHSKSFASEKGLHALMSAVWHIAGAKIAARLKPVRKITKKTIPAEPEGTCALWKMLHMPRSSKQRADMVR